MFFLAFLTIIFNLTLNFNDFLTISHPSLFCLSVTGFFLPLHCFFMSLFLISFFDYFSHSLCLPLIKFLPHDIYFTKRLLMNFLLQVHCHARHVTVNSTKCGQKNHWERSVRENKNQREKVSVQDRTVEIGCRHKCRLEWE